MAICKVCGEDVTHRKKSEHYKANHPEYGFMRILYESAKCKSKTRYICQQCGANHGSINTLTAHYNREHSRVIRNLPAPNPVNPDQSVEYVADIIARLSNLVQELRAERDDLKMKYDQVLCRGNALAANLITAQEILAKGGK